MLCASNDSYVGRSCESLEGAQCTFSSQAQLARKLRLDESHGAKVGLVLEDYLESLYRRL